MNRTAYVSILTAILISYAEFQTQGSLKVVLIGIAFLLCAGFLLLPTAFQNNNDRHESVTHRDNFRKAAFVLAALAAGALALAVTTGSITLASICACATVIALFSWAGQRTRAEQFLILFNAIAITAPANVILLRFFALHSPASLVAVFSYPFVKLLNLLGNSNLSAFQDFIVRDGQMVHASNLMRPDFIAIPLAILLTFQIGSLKGIVSLIAAAVTAWVINATLSIWMLTTFVGQFVNTEWWPVFSGVLYAIIVLSISHPKVDERIYIHQIERAYATAAAALLLLAILCRLTSHPRQTATIWIDETHGKWEPAAGRLDTVSYGRNTTYNYALLREWLETRYNVRILNDSLPESLACQILIIKLPTLSFSEREIATIKDFVSRGGTLLVIGDHTDLFGSQKVSNQLLSAVGACLNNDATIPFQGREYQHRFKWWNSSIAFKGLVDLNFQTSCSITASTLRANPLITATGLVAEHGEYSNDRFFGDLTISPDDQREPLCLCAAIPFHKGVVLIFGDSTIWSSFSFFTPPYKELLDNLIQYGLKRPDGHWVYLALMTAIAGVLVVLFGRTNRLYLVTLSTLSILGWSIAVNWAAFEPEPVRLGNRERSVFIDGENSGIDLSTDIRTKSDLDLRTYSGFLAGMPRLGYWPEIQKLNYASLSSGDRVVIISPAKSLTPNTQRAVEEFVRRGGNVLLMIELHSGRPPKGIELARRMGVDCELDILPKRTYRPAGPSLPSAAFALPFSSLFGLRHGRGTPLIETAELRAGLMRVEPLLLDENGLCIFGRKSLGKGWFYVFLGSEVFSQFAFGDVWGGVEPDKFRRELYRGAYWVIGEFCKQPSFQPERHR